MKTDKHSALSDLRETGNDLHENFHHFLCGKGIENCHQMACFAAIIQHIWIDMHTDMQGDTITMFYHSPVHNILYRHGHYVRSCAQKCLVFIHRWLRNIHFDFILQPMFFQCSYTDIVPHTLRYMSSTYLFLDLHFLLFLQHARNFPKDNKSSLWLKSVHNIPKSTRSDAALVQLGISCVNPSIQCSFTRYVFLE